MIMKKYFTIVLFFVVQVCGGQNLVPNWSFEDTISCAKMVGWSSYRLTPNYLSSCNNGQFGVPSNLFGYQSSLLEFIRIV
jgi:hypothetical protein